MGVKLGLSLLREGHTLIMWELKNRMLRRIFGPKREEVIGGWRKV
jgi:hypothetical protein